MLFVVLTLLNEAMAAASPASAAAAE